MKKREGTAAPTPSGRPSPYVGDGHRYDIAMTGSGMPIMFTWWKGHRFAGWPDREAFLRAESNGWLAWDDDGNPILTPPAGDPE